MVNGDSICCDDDWELIFVNDYQGKGGEDVEMYFDLFYLGLDYDCGE